MRKHTTKYVQACVPIDIYKALRDTALEKETSLSGLIRDILEAWHYNNERRFTDGEENDESD